MNNKKVLIIAYLFPPIGGGGVQRAVKMAKYLGEFGWEPHILTVEPEYHVSLDESLLEQLPDNVHIHRSREWALGRKAIVQRVAAEPSSKAHTDKSTVKDTPQKQGNDAAGAQSAQWKRTIFQWLKRVKGWILIPDDQIVWFPSAAAKALTIMQDHSIDAVVSTSGPVTNHLVGLYVKRKTGKPWVADFRDPWTQNMHRSGLRWREWLEERLERMVLRESDCLLTVTQSFANNFAAKFPQELKRVEVIHNGFDRADYASLAHVVKAPEDAEVCTFIYTGIFYKERNPRLFLQAVKALMDEGKLPSERIKLQFAGVFDYPGYSENMDCVRALGLESIVEVMGHLPHQQALAAMKRADILMLVGDTAPASGDYIPGKLFEYMAIGHPILALSVPGESTAIIEQYNLGVVADPKDSNAIQTAVLELYEQWAAKRALGQQDQGQIIEQTKEQMKEQTLEQGHAQVPASIDLNESSKALAESTPPSLKKYERKEQAKMLAKLLEELTDQARETTEGI